MSALAMILTATIVVPGDVPEKVSGEMVQGLDLSGRWKVILRLDGNEGPIRTDLTKWGTVDEGAGRVHFTSAGLTAYGIYEQRGDCVLICVAKHRKPRPIRFEDGADQYLLILHRVKPRK